MALHAARIQASAEAYMGLVEVGVGVVPAGGGCKELLLRFGDAKRAFELIGYAKVSDSAAHARELGLLRSADGITMNRERLLCDAKAAALALTPIVGAGPAARRTSRWRAKPATRCCKMGVTLAREGGYISEYDTVVGEKLAYVLSGGKLYRHADR